MSRSRSSLGFAVALAAFGPLALQAQNCAVPGADIAAWWDGDQVGPGIVYDLLGENHLVGNASTSPLIVGDGLRFDDSPSDSLTLGQPLLDSTEPFAIECWIRMDPGATGTHTIIAEVGAETTSNEGQFALRHLSNGTIQFLRKTGSGESVRLVNTPIVVPNGIPTHVVAMFGQDNLSDDNLEVWINGQQFNSVGGSMFNTSLSHECRVGTTNGDSTTFHGEIDELIVYRRALQDDEILGSFLAGTNGRCKACVPIESGVLHHWTGDALCDGYALDDEGGVALAPRGSGSQAEGIVGTAFETGASSYFTAGGQIAPLNGDFSMECWIRPDTLTGNTGIVTEFGTGAPVEGQWALRKLSDGELQFWRMNANTNCPSGGSPPCVVTYNTPANQLAVDRWTHVGVTYDGTDVLIYVDGELSALTIHLSFVALSNPISFDIGAYSGVSPFVGRIDEVSLFGRTLSPSEVDARYRAGRWGRCATPNQLVCHLGDEVDFVLETQVNGQLDPGASQKFATTGDILEVTMTSPGGSFIGAVPALALDLLPAGSDLPAFPGIPGLHLGVTTQVVFNGLSQGPLGFTLLPTNGLTFAFAVPNGLQGQLVRFQSVAFFPIRFISNAHDIEIR